MVEYPHPPDMGPGYLPPVLTPSGSHRNTYSWQAGSMHPTGMLSRCVPSCSRGGGCIPACTGADTPPPPDGHCSGRYASYWNAFLWNYFVACRGVVWKSTDVDSWCVPFQGSDRSVVNRTMRYLHDEKNQRAVSKKWLERWAFCWNNLCVIYKNLSDI